MHRRERRNLTRETRGRSLCDPSDYSRKVETMVLERMFTKGQNHEHRGLRILKFASFKTARRFVAIKWKIDSVRRKCVFLTTALKPALNETKLRTIRSITKFGFTLPTC